MIPLLSQNRSDSSLAARTGRARSAIILLLFLLSGLVVLSVLKVAYFKTEQSTVPSEYRFRESEATNANSVVEQPQIEVEAAEAPVDSELESPSLEPSTDQP